MYAQRVTSAPPSTPTPAPLPPPQSSPYDGRWSGGGSGRSSESTLARIDLMFDVVGGRIANLSFPWRIDTRPGTAESTFCGGIGTGGDVQINNGLFQLTGPVGEAYSVRISGAFSSPSAISGVAQFARQASAQPWCPSATIAWLASRR